MSRLRQTIIVSKWYKLEFEIDWYSSKILFSRIELLVHRILTTRVSTLSILHTLLPRETFLFPLNTFHCFRLCIGFKTSFQISPFSHRLFSINRSDFMKIQLLLKDKGHTGRAPGRLGGPLMAALCFTTRAWTCLPHKNTESIYSHKTVGLYPYCV